MAAPWLGSLNALLGVHLHNSSRARGDADALPADARRALQRTMGADRELLQYVRHVRLQAQLRAACACRPALCKARPEWRSPSPAANSSNATAQHARALFRLAGAMAQHSLSEQEAFSSCFTQHATGRGTGIR